MRKSPRWSGNSSSGGTEAAVVGRASEAAAAAAALTVAENDALMGAERGCVGYQSGTWRATRRCGTPAETAPQLAGGGGERRGSCGCWERVHQRWRISRSSYGSRSGGGGTEAAAVRRACKQQQRLRHRRRRLDVACGCGCAAASREHGEGTAWCGGLGARRSLAISSLVMVLSIWTEAAAAAVCSPSFQRRRSRCITRRCTWLRHDASSTASHGQSSL